MSRAGMVTLAAAVVIAAGVLMVSQRAPGIAAGSGEVHGHGPAPVSAQTAVITVPAGAGAGTIARQMQQAGVIDDASLFRALAGLMQLENTLSAGEYAFTRGMPAAEVVGRLRAGITVPSVTVTIPEGWRLEQMAALFEQQGLTTAQEFMQAAAATDYPELIAQNRPPGSTLEGMLFPDTYFFTTQITAHQIVERLLKTFDERFDAQLRAAAQAQNLTPLQAVTLASIVEREAQVPGERPLIAAVFLNRLKAGMPLQSDPTVQYALASDPASVQKYGWWKQNLTVDDLKAQSPYNTYLNRGLPPGPIASPGLASLRAVANPAPVKYLYFVAKGDGSHAFAETLDEHNRNVQKYQR